MFKIRCLNEDRSNGCLFREMKEEERTVDTGNAPLALGNKQWHDGVLNTHHQIVEFLQRQDAKHQVELVRW